MTLRWTSLVLALLLALGCGRPSTVDPPADADGDVDADLDGDVDADAEVDADDDAEVDGDLQVDADPDAEVDAEVDADVDVDGASPTCTCPTPFESCGPLSEVAFSHWDSSLSEQLLQGIACAQATLDIAVYDIDAPCLVEALLAATAANPALEVRVVTEFDNCGRVDGELTCELSRLEAAGVAEVIVDTRASYLMHTKFMVIDGEQAIVTTANWTDNGLCSEFNGSLLIEEAAIVDALEAEFDRFFVDGSFGNTPWDEPISDGGVDLYFSPSGADWQDELLARINSADGAIHFLVFSFTREDLAQAMIDAATRGVEVQGVIASRFFTPTYPAVQMMVDAGLDIRVADVHHKTVLIEGSGGGTLVTGSGNLSSAARDHNNEVVLFLDDATLFEAFSSEFDQIWAIATVEPLGGE